MCTCHCYLTCTGDQEVTQEHRIRAVLDLRVHEPHTRCVRFPYSFPAACFTPVLALNACSNALSNDQPQPIGCMQGITRTSRSRLWSRTLPAHSPSECMRACHCTCMVASFCCESARCSALRFASPNSLACLFRLLLARRFRRWTNNSDYFHSDCPSTLLVRLSDFGSVPSVLLRSVVLSLCQAFSHWTYQHTRGTYLVVDHQVSALVFTRSTLCCWEPRNLEGSILDLRVTRYVAGLRKQQSADRSFRSLPQGQASKRCVRLVTCSLLGAFVSLTLGDTDLQEDGMNCFFRVSALCYSNPD
jgi:hypothetical protein